MKKFLSLSLSDVVFIMLINVKMPTIVGLLTFISRIIFVLCLVEYEQSFITSGPGLAESHLQQTDLSSAHVLHLRCFYLPSEHDERPDSDLAAYCLQYRLPKNISTQVEQTVKVMTRRLRVKSQA